MATARELRRVNSRAHQRLAGTSRNWQTLKVFPQIPGVATRSSPLGSPGGEHPAFVGCMGADAGGDQSVDEANVLVLCYPSKAATRDAVVGPDTKICAVYVAVCLPRRVSCPPSGKLLWAQIVWVWPHGTDHEANARTRKVVLVREPVLWHNGVGVGVGYPHVPQRSMA